MFVQATRFKREMRSLKRMSRAELLAEIGERADCLPPELQMRGGDETMVRLRLILFAARLVQTLRRMPRHRRVGRMFVEGNFSLWPLVIASPQREGHAASS